MVTDKFGRKPGCANKRNPFGGPPLKGRSHLHRGIFDSSPARSVITPGITTRKTFHPPPDPQNGAWQRRASAGGWRTGKKRVVKRRLTRAALPSRDVVKYVAIYTGDWRHWCLGSERVRTSPLFPLCSFSSIIPWSTEFSPLWSRQPLTPARAGVACRIKKTFGKSRCLPERCKIKAGETPPRTSLHPPNLSIRICFFPSFFATNFIDIRFPEKPARSSKTIIYLTIH